MENERPNRGHLDSEAIRKLLDEVRRALEDKKRTIEYSDIPEMLGGVACGTAGFGVGLGAVYFAGQTGFSAAGVTSGLGTIGGIVGGGMVAGIFVAGAPMVILAMGGYAVLSKRKKNKLRQEKEALLQKLLSKHDALIRELYSRLDQADECIRSLDVLLREYQASMSESANGTKHAEDRANYLEALVLVLWQVIADLLGDRGQDPTTLLGGA